MSQRGIAENRIAATELLRRIKELPISAPSDVRAQLWTAYNSLTEGFHDQPGPTVSRLLVTKRPPD